MLLLQAEKEIRHFTEKLHVQIVNKPRSPRCGIISKHLTFSLWQVEQAEVSGTDSEFRHTPNDYYVTLKVVGNEKNGGSGRSQMLGYGVGPWRSMFIYNLNMQF